MTAKKKKTKKKRAPSRKKVEQPDFEEKVVEDLPIVLTEHDIALHSSQSASLHGEIKKLQDDFKDVKKEWNGKIKDRQGELDDMMEVIRTGIEYQEVEAMKKVFKRRVEYWSLDGKTMLHERPTEESDRQMRLGLNGKSDKSEASEDFTPDTSEPEQVFGTA